MAYIVNNSLPQLLCTACFQKLKGHVDQAHLRKSPLPRLATFSNCDSETLLINQAIALLTTFSLKGYSIAFVMRCKKVIDTVNNYRAVQQCTPLTLLVSSKLYQEFDIRVLINGGQPEICVKLAVILQHHGTIIAKISALAVVGK